MEFLDANWHCTLPEGHKGLHQRVSPDGYADMWAGFAYHTAEPAQTIKTTIDALSGWPDAPLNRVCKE